MPDYRKNKDKTILNLEVVKQELDDAEVYEDEDGNKLQTIYLGSILSLTPSGKFYTPWASSNVCKCQRCKGTGYIKNPRGRTKKYNSLRKQLMNLRDNMRRQGYNYPIDWPSGAYKKFDKIYKTSRKYEPSITCTECNGMMSLEARLDQDWWNRLEEELDTIEAWSHGSEGDGCDVMVSRQR